MTRDEIVTEVVAIIRQQKASEAELDLTTPLAEAGIDSLDALNILFAVEERFQISIPDDLARGIRTLGDMVSAIEGLVSARPA